MSLKTIVDKYVKTGRVDDNLYRDVQWSRGDVDFDSHDLEALSKLDFAERQQVAKQNAESIKAQYKSYMDSEAAKAETEREKIYREKFSKEQEQKEKPFDSKNNKRSGSSPATGSTVKRSGASDDKE